MRGQPLQVYGDGQQSRCFADVADVVDAIAKLSQHPGAIGHVFNIGNTEEITIQHLAECVISLTGSNSGIQYIPYDQAYAPGFEDMRRRVPCLDKVKELIDYKPRYSLEDTLRRVIAYEQDRLDSDHIQY